MSIGPLLFNPIFKQTIWGGETLKKEFNKSSPLSHIGESWELSCVDGNISVVKEGPFEGRALDSLLVEYGPRILGKKIFDKTGPALPLLFKFIDAAQDLSIQVHPGDALAQERHETLGKTEMWYILSAKPGARLFSGFKKEIHRKNYIESVKNGGFVDALASHEVKAGDVFFIPSGRVHAIGAGIVLAEIQQTSDITYRIYDYSRPGPDGKPRQLHTELAEEAIDFRIESDYKTPYTSKPNEAVAIAACKFFTVNLIELNGAIRRDLKAKDSFVVYMCAEGAASLECGDKKLQLRRGDTILIPAESADIMLESQGAKLLEVYI